MAALNALQPLANIVNYAELATNHGKKIRPELFYNKQLEDTIRLDQEHFIHFRVADVRPIQGKAEKLQLRRWAPLRAHTIPLSEGVPPKSDKGSMESYELGTNAYGRYMEFSDRVDFETIDPVVAHYTQEYSIVAMETLDLLARDALISIAQPYFANNRTSIGELEKGDKATLTDFRYITLVMKKQLVKPRSNGKWHVIGTPDFFYDMIDDPVVEKYMTFNNTTKNMYDDGKLVPMFNLEWYETMHHNDSGEFVNDSAQYELRAYRLNTNTQLYEYVNIPESYRTTVTDTYEKDSRTGFDASFIPSQIVWDIAQYNTDNVVDGYGDFQELKIHRVLVLGKDALIRTNIEGRDKAKMFVKPLGSAGVLDPIDQRQSIGFKIDAVGFGTERIEAVACMHCVPDNANY